MDRREIRGPGNSHRHQESRSRHDNHLSRRRGGPMVTRLASKSQQLYDKARGLIPGGVNSPVRSYPPYPFFVKSAQGAKFMTVDGQEYLDYCMAYGALLDGHAYSETADAAKLALDNGSIFGQPTEQEVDLARAICD